MNEVKEYLEFELGSYNADAFIEYEDSRRLVVYCELDPRYYRELEDDIYAELVQVQECVIGRANYKGGGSRFNTSIEVTI